MSLTKRQLKARRKFVGGSEVLAALGKDPRCSRLELYLRKRGELPDPDLSDNERVHFGNLLEPAMRKEFKRRMAGVPVLAGTEFRNGLSNLIAHPDGWMPSLHCGVEFKNVDKHEAEDYGEEQTDQVPLRHLVQCMSYMVVTGAPRWYLCPFIGGNDFRVYRIQRDEQLCDGIEIGVRMFWTHVEAGLPPDPATPEDVKLRWPKDDSSFTVASPEIVEACNELNVAITNRKAAELREGSLKMQIQKFMGSSSDLVDEQGNKLATWRTSKDSSPVIDLDKLGAAEPETLAHLLDVYPKPRPGARKFLLK